MAGGTLLTLALLIPSDGNVLADRPGASLPLPSSPLLPLPSQAADTVDRVIAVVGNTVILQSHVAEEVFSRNPAGETVPGEGTPERRALEAEVLQELIDLELLYQRAITDTAVRVTEEEVNAAVDQQIRAVRQRFPNDLAYRNDLRNAGFQTPEEYRRWLTERQRKQLLTNRLVEHFKATERIKPVVPTEREMRAFFDANRGSQQRPETVSFDQVVIAPKPSAETRARALAQADSILQELRKGGDFATAARRFSQDPGSREQGGTLGWFRRGIMYPAFEAAAFALRPGVISNPVETPYGFHLIQVERVQPAEVLARHILIAPELTSADADSARALAERIREAVSAGASIDSIQRLHHDPLEERQLRGLPLDRLQPGYAAALGGVEAPGVAPVVELPVPGRDANSRKYAVLKLTERVPAGELRYQDVKDNIRTQLGERMMLRRFLDSLREATYVEVRGP